MSQSQKLEDIQGDAVKRNLFAGFAVKDTLMEYDFPLLIVAGPPRGENWLFKWCDTIREPIHSEVWIAFEVSESRLASLKQGKISLREAVTLPEYEFYVLKAETLFKPNVIKRTSPERLPTDYVPTDDISVNGTSLRLKAQDEERLYVRLHVVPEYIEKEVKAPLSTISDLQREFQQYMTSVADAIDRTARGQVLAPPIEWSKFSLTSVSLGSFKMECVSNSNRGQSEKLSKACELLAKLSTGDLNEIKSIKEQIGPVAIPSAFRIASLVSQSNLSMSISWTPSSSSSTNGYLAIDKRRADAFLELFKDERSLGLLEVERPRPITITLTEAEAEPLRRPVRGIGGMQDLFLGLQRKLTKGNTIQLTPVEIERILRYGRKYGRGGFQYRLAGLVRVLKQVGASFFRS